MYIYIYIIIYIRTYTCTYIHTYIPCDQISHPILLFIAVIIFNY